MSTKTKNIPWSKLYSYVERDHGGCDEETCSLRQAMEDGDDRLAVYLWSCTGASCEKFDALYSKYEKKIRKENDV